jgi:hypothetical protein
VQELAIESLLSPGCVQTDRSNHFYDKYYYYYYYYYYVVLAISMGHGGTLLGHTPRYEFTHNGIGWGRMSTRLDCWGIVHIQGE